LLSKHFSELFQILRDGVPIAQLDVMSQRLGVHDVVEVVADARGKLLDPLTEALEVRAVRLPQSNVRSIGTSRRSRKATD